jgi:malate dehydrogenase (oxaloacetate-decarboxylating)(NADP+)
MHDDQHGTAIISAAALLNATELVGKDLSKVKIIVNGAGASAISCSKLYLALGASKENLFMFDSKGLIHPSRTNLDGKKSNFVNANLPAETTLEEAMKGADVFVGLSKGNVVSQDMVKSMNKDAIIFALANPTPEIAYEEAMAAREDIIMATGRSDYPNQVNNVLGFPYIFRGALDVRASEINEEMKVAAVRSLAELAKKPVPDLVNLAYSEVNLSFGKNYIIPKPVDPRLITTVAPAVAKAAMETGVAKHPIEDWDAYEIQLSKRLGQDNTLSRVIMTKAQKNPKRVVYADAENITVLKAIQQVVEDKIAIPVLLGNKEKIKKLLHDNRIHLDKSVEIIDPRNPANPTEVERLTTFANFLYEKRQRKGMTYQDAKNFINFRTYYGCLMVKLGLADTMIGGMTRNYPDTIKPALQVIGPAEGVNKIFGIYILMSRFGPLFLADTTINFDPEVEDLVQIAEITSDFVKQLNMKPRTAFVTYSNFGSVPNGPAPMRLRKAVDILRKKHPDMVVDGEMQAHLAFDTELLKEHHPFSSLADGPANVLIFPNLSSANIAYNMLKEVAGIEKVGPLLLGLKKPIQVLQQGATVREIVNLTAISVLETLKPE